MAAVLVRLLTGLTGDGDVTAAVSVKCLSIISLSIMTGEPWHPLLLAAVV